MQPDPFIAEQLSRMCSRRTCSSPIFPRRANSRRACSCRATV